jgi:hypothetical protein
MGGSIVEAVGGMDMGIGELKERWAVKDILGIGNGTTKRNRSPFLHPRHMLIPASFCRTLCILG